MVAVLEWTLGSRRIPVWMVIRLSAEVTRRRPRNVDFKIRPICRSDLRLCSLLLGSHGGTEVRRYGGTEARNRGERETPNSPWTMRVMPSLIRDSPKLSRVSKFESRQSKVGQHQLLVSWMNLFRSTTTFPSTIKSARNPASNPGPSFSMETGT